MAGVYQMTLPENETPPETISDPQIPWEILFLGFDSIEEYEAELDDQMTDMARFYSDP
jgi:hypothetical protein